MDWRTADRSNQNSYQKILVAVLALSFKHLRGFGTPFLVTTKPTRASTPRPQSKEKGSDINIAAFLLRDAFRGECEAAIVISNDSDLTTPIYIARKELRLRVVCLMPRRAPRRPSVELRKAASFHQIISDASLAKGQFAPTLTDANGTFTKPVGW